MSTILDQINGPEDVKALALEDLPQLASEIRDRVVEVMPINGGHFGSSLGVVELTIALHRVFDFSRDQIVLDVAHQCYPHKLLTGRREWYRQIRTKGGPAGYTCPSESKYDWFMWAHAGTSISTALGMARGNRDNDTWAVAIIGDGSIPTGVAWEALNHSGVLENERLITILNDNDMSIAPTVGALSGHLKAVKAEHRETGEVGKGDGNPTSVGRLWEALGQRYTGPHDGHDLFALIKMFEEIKAGGKGRFVHLMTVKGKGHREAEKDAWKWHAVGGAKKPGAAKTLEFSRQGSRAYTDVFVDTAMERAARDPKLEAITAAMPCGTGLKRFAPEFPDQFYDTGIAEQHAVAFAAGLAKAGRNVLCAIYSTFLQRAYDQLFQEIALNEQPVVLCLDRGGIVGPDGATHNGCFDIAYMRSLPHIRLMAPRDATELKAMLNFGLDERKSVAVRYPRTAAPAEEQEFPHETPLEWGRSETLREGADVAILAYGSMVYPAMDAADLLAEAGVSATVVNARFVRPLDQSMLQSVLERHKMVFTVEEGTLHGGFGSACLESAAKNRWMTDRLFPIGIGDHFVEHGTRPEIMEMIGLDPAGIARQIEEAMAQRPSDVAIERESEAY